MIAWVVHANVFVVDGAVDDVRCIVEWRSSLSAFLVNI